MFAEKRMESLIRSETADFDSSISSSGEGSGLRRILRVWEMFQV